MQKFTTMLRVNVRRLLNLPLLYTHRNLWRVHPYRFASLAKIPINKPIFLLGVQGGGLTLLARMLRRHPVMVSVTGNNTYWAGPDEMQNVMGDFLPPQLTGLHSKIPPHPQYPRRDWLYAIDDLLPLYRQTAVNATPVIQSRFQKAIRLSLAIYAKDPAQARFIDKSQTYTVRLGLINALLSEYTPYFILVTRNPYALCYRAATQVKTLASLDLPLEKRLALAGQHWANSMKTALQDAPSVTNFKIIRFENLLTSPEETLKQICQFIELPYLPTMLPMPEDRFPLGATGSSKGDHKWYPLRTDVNRRYLEALEPWMVDVLDSHVGKLAVKWRYAPKE